MNKVIIDCSTGQESVVPLSQEELDEMASVQAQFEASEAAAAAKAAEEAAAKESGIAKLLALGLTQEEANALIK